MPVMVSKSGRTVASDGKLVASDGSYSLLQNNKNMYSNLTKCASVDGGRSEMFVRHFSDIHRTQGTDALLSAFFLATSAWRQTLDQGNSPATMVNPFFAAIQWQQNNPRNNNGNNNGWSGGNNQQQNQQSQQFSGNNNYNTGGNNRQFQARTPPIRIFERDIADMRNPGPQAGLHHLQDDQVKISDDPDVQIITLATRCAGVDLQQKLMREQLWPVWVRGSADDKSETLNRCCEIGALLTTEVETLNQNDWDAYTDAIRKVNSHFGIRETRLLSNAGPGLKSTPGSKGGSQDMDYQKMFEVAMNFAREESKQSFANRHRDRNDRRSYGADSRSSADTRPIHSDASDDDMSMASRPTRDRIYDWDQRRQFDRRKEVARLQSVEIDKHKSRLFDGDMNGYRVGDVFKDKDGHEFELRRVVPRDMVAAKHEFQSPTKAPPGATEPPPSGNDAPRKSSRIAAQQHAHQRGADPVGPPAAIIPPLPVAAAAGGVDAATAAGNLNGQG